MEWNDRKGKTADGWKFGAEAEISLETLLDLFVLSMEQLPGSRHTIDG